MQEEQERVYETVRDFLLLLLQIVLGKKHFNMKDKISLKTTLLVYLYIMKYKIMLYRLPTQSLAFLSTLRI